MGGPASYRAKNQGIGLFVTDEPSLFDQFVEQARVFDEVEVFSDRGIDGTKDPTVLEKHLPTRISK